MGNEKIAFIVRVKDNFNSACRCINSIRRQTVDSYTVKLFVYDEEIAKQLAKEYPKYRITLVKDDVDFRNKVNSIISRMKSKYGMLINSDALLVNDAVETILRHDEDMVVFNFAKSDSRGRFQPFYPGWALTDEARFMSQTQSVWTFAFKPQMLIDNKVKFRGLQYPKQLLFMYMCFAMAKTVAFETDVLLYKWTALPRHEITADFYEDNLDSIKRMMKSFRKKGNKRARALIIKNIIAVGIESSFDKPFFKKMKKALPIIKMFWF